MLDFKAILFDLDGTLVDSLPDIIAAVRLTEQELGLSSNTDEQIRDWIGNGAKVLIRRVVTGEAEQQLSESQWQQAFDVFMRHYAEQGTKLTKLYDGVEHLLQTLQQRGMPMALVTNKPKAITVELIRILQIDQYFDVVLGAGDVPNNKPAPDMLLLAAERLGIQVQDCLMVGDSSNDVKAARNADMLVAAVRGGYNHGEPIEQSDPDWVLDNLSELLEPLPSP